MASMPASASEAVTKIETAVPSREETMARLMRGYSRVADFRRDREYTVADRLEERAADSADTPFILFEDERISFSQANAMANRIARAMMDAGLQRGDVVALMMHNRPDFVLMWLGLAKAGIVTALINTSAAGSVLDHALRQVDARALIFGTELAGAIADLPEGDRLAFLFEHTETGDKPAALPGTHDLNALIDAAADRDIDPASRSGIVMADPLYYIFTSGTTGLPKAARMSHLRFINAGEMVGGLMEFGPGDVFYCVLPLYHGAGGMVVPSVSLAFGTPFVLRRKFSASGFWPDVRRHGITAFNYIGEIVRYLLASNPSPDDRKHSLRVITGAGLRADVWRAFVDRFGVERVLENLGATESNYGITNVDNRVGSVGRVPYREQTNLRVMRWDGATDDWAHDESGNPIEAEAGEVGELIAEALDGNGVGGFFEGYTSEEATERKLVRNLFRSGDRWVRSGDLVRFDEEDYFYFVDRIGDTFRWKSENVSTEEVASILADFPGPLMVNVFGVRVPGTEGRAGMVALTYQSEDAFDPAGFYEFAATHLPHYAVPLFVRIGAAARMTTTFKLEKLRLQKEGYAPHLVGDDFLYVIDHAQRSYARLDENSLARAELPPFAPED
jgi:fatty-acyl-CoA synthase|tara:strand:- start:162783 stop:164639 length:1857 start_codon:yes stop_codon:yes gene_type:complete